MMFQLIIFEIIYYFIMVYINDLPPILVYFSYIIIFISLYKVIDVVVTIYQYHKLDYRMPKVETLLSMDISKFNKEYEKQQNEKVDFFKMNSDRDGLKFQPYIVIHSRKEYIHTVLKIIKLCKENKNKCQSDEIPDFSSYTTFKTASEEQRKVIKRLEKCVKNDLNLHIDLNSFYSSLNSRLEAIPNNDDIIKLDMNKALNEITLNVGAAFYKVLHDEKNSNLLKKLKFSIKNDYISQLFKEYRDHPEESNFKRMHEKYKYERFIDDYNRSLEKTFKKTNEMEIKSGDIKWLDSQMVNCMDLPIYIRSSYMFSYDKIPIIKDIIKNIGGIIFGVGIFINCRYCIAIGGAIYGIILLINSFKNNNGYELTFSKPIPESTLSNFICKYNSVYEKLTGEECTFFRMDNDHHDLKFLSSMRDSSHNCEKVTIKIFKLCQENKSKCILDDHRTDLIHKEPEQNYYSETLDKTYGSMVNSHIDLDHFYLSLKSRFEAIPDHPDHDNFKKMDITDALNEIMYGVSTSKVGAAFCRHLLVEGYQNVFENKNHTKEDLSIYRDSLMVAILCTIRNDLTLSERDSCDDIEQYINDTLVNDTVKKNLDIVLGKMTNFHNHPLVNAFRYRIESTDHRRDDRVTLIEKSNEPHKGIQILEKVN